MRLTLAEIPSHGVRYALANRGKEEKEILVIHGPQNAQCIDRQTSTWCSPRALSRCGLSAFVAYFAALNTLSDADSVAGTHRTAMAYAVRKSCPKMLSAPNPALIVTHTSTAMPHTSVTDTFRDGSLASRPLSMASALNGSDVARESSRRLCSTPSRTFNHGKWSPAAV